MKSWQKSKMSRYTEFLRAASLIPFVILIYGCSSGAPAVGIPQKDVFSAYLPLRKLDLGIIDRDAAAMVIAPGIAATNEHNKNLIDSKSIIGIARDYDLMFFRTTKTVVPEMAAPIVNEGVTAYGQGSDGELRVAHGKVQEIKQCEGCAAPAYFIFSNSKRREDTAGPGFSGGTVLDGSGRLVGITFGYKDEGRQRLIYAYDMSRVRVELAALAKASN